MWPFRRTHRFPGVKQNADGTIDFSLTKEEAAAADSALKNFQGFVVHPDCAERIRNGTIAVALSHYAKDLIALNCAEVPDKISRSKWANIQSVLEKAIASTWKAYSLWAAPVFIYQRASFLKMLGEKVQALELFARFADMQPKFHSDQSDDLLFKYEGTDIEHALAHARRETSTVSS